MFKSMQKKQHVKRPPNDAVTTVIGEGCTIEGDIHGVTYMRIDGEVQGSITTQGGVVIGHEGKVIGDIQCRELIVYGSLYGNVNVELLELRESARTHGDMKVKHIKINQGAVYNGMVKMDQSRPSEHVVGVLDLHQQRALAHRGEHENAAEEELIEQRRP